MKLVLDHECHLPTGVLGLSTTPDGQTAFAACADGLVYRVDPAADEMQALEGRHDSFASGCVLLPGEETLISAGYDGVLLWHDVATGECLRRVSAHDFWSWRLALSSDGARLASVTGQYVPGSWKYHPAASEEPTVKVFDAASGELAAAFDLAPPVLSCAFTPDGAHVAAANMMGDVRVWNLDSGSDAAGGGEPTSSWNTPDFTSWGTTKSHHYSGGVYALAFSPDGDTLLGCGMGPMRDPMAGNGKMTWQRWDWRTGEKLDEIKEDEQGSGLMEAVTWRPDGDCFAMAGRQAQGTWNAALFSADGALIDSADTKKRITQAAFSADGRLLFLAGAKGQPKRNDGEWGRWGRLQVYHLDDAEG